MFQREVTAGSLFGEDTEEEKITTCGYHPPKRKIPPYRVMSHCVTSLLPPHSKSHSVSFFALMWPEVERRSTSKCVGPSIIPPCKYLHKETSPLAPAGQKKRVPSLGLSSLAEPYTAMTGVGERKPANRGGGGDGGRRGEKDEREENEKVGRFGLREGNQKKEDRWTGGLWWFKRATSEQSLPLCEAADRGHGFDTRRRCRTPSPSIKRAPNGRAFSRRRRLNREGRISLDAPPGTGRRPRARSPRTRLISKKSLRWDRRDGTPSKRKQRLAS